MADQRSPQKISKHKYEIVPDKDIPGAWRAERIGADGECYTVILIGPDAELQATAFGDSGGWFLANKYKDDLLSVSLALGKVTQNIATAIEHAATIEQERIGLKQLASAAATWILGYPTDSDEAKLIEEAEPRKVFGELFKIAQEQRNAIVDAAHIIADLKAEVERLKSPGEELWTLKRPRSIG